MFKKTKTRDFIVFLAFLLLFSGKKRNVFPCLVLNPFSLQTTIITKRFLSFISSVALFSPHLVAYDASTLLSIKLKER